MPSNHVLYCLSINLLMVEGFVEFVLNTFVDDSSILLVFQFSSCLYKNPSKGVNRIFHSLLVPILNILLSL